MTMLDDRHDSPAELDPFTTERLLLGSLAPDDAPPGYTGVARIVAAIRAPGRPEEVVGVDAAVLAALVVLTEGANDRRSLRQRAERTRRAVKAKVGALVFAGTLVGTSGLAAAGALPAPLQHVASRALAKVGITVPDPNHGDAVSDVATTTGLTGRDKGKAVSDAAKDNHGHGDGRGPGGDHGKSDEPHGKSDEPHGKSDEPHGKSDDQHGKSDEPHGKSDDKGSNDGDHGNSGGSHGNPDHGNTGSDNPHGVSGSGPSDPSGSDGGNSSGNGNGGGHDASAGGDPGNGNSNGGGHDASAGGDPGNGNSNGGGNGNGNGGGPPSDATVATDAPTGPTGGAGSS